MYGGAVRATASFGAAWGGVAAAIAAAVVDVEGFSAVGVGAGALGVGVRAARIGARVGVCAEIGVASPDAAGLAVAPTAVGDADANGNGDGDADVDGDGAESATGTGVVTGGGRRETPAAAAAAGALVRDGAPPAGATGWAGDAAPGRLG